MKNWSQGFVDLVIGLFWGDEGKGKAILDILSTGKYTANARYQGGPNAGHTLYVNGKKFVAHMLPSGVAIPTIKYLLIGNDVVIDPLKLRKEIEEAESLGMNVRSRLLVSNKATLISQMHKVLDAASEWHKSSNGGSAIGTTGSGIGPAYADAASRDAVKVGMLADDNFANILLAAKKRHEIIIDGFVEKGLELSESMMNNPEFNAAGIQEYYEAVVWMKKNIKIVDINLEVQLLMKFGENILAEGAQGVMLDVGFGDYPFTTCSVTTGHGVFHGLGIGPKDFGTLYGVMKPYVTKVGGGSFPSRMPPEIEQYFQEEGGEVGATTGRKRMCGYFDFPAFIYACELHRGFGKIKIYLTKTDIFPKEVKEMFVVTRYCHKNGTRGKGLRLPLKDITDVVKEKIHPVKTISGTKEWYSNFPLDDFINRIHSAGAECGLDIEVVYVGTGCNIGDMFMYSELSE